MHHCEKYLWEDLQTWPVHLSDPSSEKNGQVNTHWLESPLVFLYFRRWLVQHLRYFLLLASCSFIPLNALGMRVHLRNNYFLLLWYQSFLLSVDSYLSWYWYLVCDWQFLNLSPLCFLLFSKLLSVISCDDFLVTNIMTYIYVPYLLVYVIDISVCSTISFSINIWSLLLQELVILLSYIILSWCCFLYWWRRGIFFVVLLWSL